MGAGLPAEESVSLFMKLNVKNGGFTMGRKELREQISSALETFDYLIST